MKILIIANVKGGVGKTTTAHLLIEGLRRRGYKTLGIDLDQQCNLTYNYRVKEGFTSYDLFKGIDIKEIIQNDFVPASKELSDVDVELSNKLGRESILKKALKQVQDVYDYVVIDTPPSTNLATVNSYVCADYAIIPSQADAYNIQSIKDCIDLAEGVAEYYQSPIKIAGLLLTRFAEKGTVNTAMKEIFSNTIGEKDIKIFNTTIRENKTITEAALIREVLFDYKPSSNGAIDYNNFIDELLLDIDPTFKKSNLIDLINKMTNYKISTNEAYEIVKKYTIQEMVEELQKSFRNDKNVSSEKLLEISPSEEHAKVILLFVVKVKREFTNEKYLTRVIKDKVAAGEDALTVLKKVYDKEIN